MCRRALTIFEYFKSQIPQMPPKKRKTSGGSLTGGSGDVKPQFLTATSVSAAGIDDYTVIAINIPRLVLQDGSGVATIMEILRLDYYMGLRDLGDADASHWAFLNTQQRRVQNETANLASAINDLSDPTTFGFILNHKHTTTTGALGEHFPHSYDCTDSNGNGILIATDRLFLTGGATGNTITSPVTVKILYRMYNADLIDYVGIVQSQQG